MASLEDYLRGSSLFDTKQEEEYNRLLSQLSAYQGNVAAGQALGLGTVTGAAKPGIVSQVLGGAGGGLGFIGKALGMPAKGVRSLVTGGRTGGEIFKTSRDDSLLERTGKLGAAFLTDVVTDPLSYVGAPASLGRKFAANVIVDPAQGARLLNVADDALKIAGRNSDEVITSLAQNSTRYKLAAKQTELGVDAVEKTPRALFDLADEGVRKELAGEELSRIIGESLITGGRGSITRNLTELFGDAKIADQVFKELPDIARGGVFLVNPITGKPIQRVIGGAGKPGAIADVANRARFGTATFVGEGVQRLTGNVGLSGRLGPAWQAVNRGLRDVLKDEGSIITSNLGRTTLPAYQAFKIADRAAQSLRHSLLFQARTAIERAPMVRNEFDEVGQQSFDSTFSDAFHLPGKARNLSDDASARAAAEAEFLRNQMETLRRTAEEYGVEIADLGPGYTPLQYSREYFEKQIATTPRGAGTRRGSLRYQSAAPRQDWVLDPTKQKFQWADTLKAAGVAEDTPLDEAIASVGYQLADGRVALAPTTINKYLRFKGELGADELRFLEDPTEIMIRYSESLSSRIAAQKLVNDSLKAGVMVVDPLTVSRQTRMLGDLVEGIRKLSPTVARRAEAALESRRQQLVTNATAGRDQVLADAKALHDETRARYQVAKNQEAAVVKTLREVTDQVDTLRKQAGNITPALREYGRSGQEQLAEQLVRSRKNVAARLKRAQAALKEAKKVSSAAARRLTRAETKAMEAEERASELLFEAQKLWDNIVEEGAEPALLQNYRKLEDLLASADEDVAQVLAKENLEETLLDEARAVVLAKTDNVSTARSRLAETTSELENVRNTSAAMRDRMNAQQRQVVADFEAALVRKSQIEQQLEDAVLIRNQFRKPAQRLATKIPLEAAQALDTLAVEYSRAYRDVQELAEEYRIKVRDGVDTDDIKLRLKAARDNASKAKKALTTAVGSWGGKGSLVAEYRKSLVDAAQKLASEELAVARIVMDDERLEELLTQVSRRSGRELEAASADLQEVFFRMRDKLTPEEYEAFRDSAAVLHSAPTRSKLPLTENTPETSSFGQYLNENDMRMLDTSPEGGSVNIPGSLSNLHTGRGVREVLENMYDVDANPGRLKGFFAEIYDPLVLLWKTGVTIGRGPAYVLTNTIGGLYMNHLAGVSAKTHREVAKALSVLGEAERQAKAELPRSARSAVTQRADEIAAEKLTNMTISGLPAVDVVGDYFYLGGREMTQTAERLEQLSRTGIITSPTELMKDVVPVSARFKGEAGGKIEETYRKVVNFGLTNKYTAKASDWAQSSEMFLRIAAYADGLSKYGSKSAAWDQMLGLHFDYQNLSNAEQQIRRLMPFYTWTRNNVPAQVRALFLQPGKIRKFLYAREEFKNAFGTDEENGWMNDFLPEYVGDVAGFATMLGGGTPLAFMGRLPFDDLDRLLKPLPKGREVATMLGPWQSGVDLLTGVNSSTGEAFNPQGEKAGGYLSLLAQVPGIGKKGRDGETRVNAWLASAVSELLPQISMVDRTLSATAGALGAVGAEGAKESVNKLVTERNKERSLQNFLNVSGLSALGGGSFVTLTPKAITGEAARRQKKQVAQIVNRAGELGVSVDWLREQLRAGYTPEQIAILIASGQGTLERVALEEVREGREVNPRYRDVFRGIQEGRVELGY